MKVNILAFIMNFSITAHRRFFYAAIGRANVAKPDVSLNCGMLNACFCNNYRTHLAKNKSPQFVKTQTMAINKSSKKVFSTSESRCSTQKITRDK